MDSTVYRICGAPVPSSEQQVTAFQFRGEFICQRCGLAKCGEVDASLIKRRFGLPAVVLDTPKQMVSHLLRHRIAGDDVPGYAFKRLEDESDNVLLN